MAERSIAESLNQVAAAVSDAVRQTLTQAEGEIRRTAERISRLPEVPRAEVTRMMQGFQQGMSDRRDAIEGYFDEQIARRVQALTPPSAGELAEVARRIDALERASDTLAAKIERGGTPPSAST